MGLEPGIPCVVILSFDGNVISAARNASNVADTPLMMRIGVGLWGEGAKWTKHLVVGGGWFASLGIP